MRKVSVGLEANVAGFINPVEASKKAVDDLGDKVDSLDRSLNKIPVDAAKAGAALKLLDGEVGSVGKSIADLGDAKGAGLAALDARIRQTKAEVRKLGDEFVKTGDVDVFAKLSDSDGLLRMLTKTRKGLTDAVTGGVGDAASSPLLKSSGLQVGVAVGAALAVPILAAVGGALNAVGGASVAGLGVYGAILGDPEKFTFAWGQAAGEVKSLFIDATRPFAAPTIEAIRGVGPLIASWHLDTVFGNAAKYVEPLVHGLEGFATGAARGVAALADKGGPAVAALSAGLTELGKAAESALGSIADGAEGGADALHDTIHATSLLIEAFGKVVEGAENAYGFIHEHPLTSALLSGGATLPISALEAVDHKTSQLVTTELGLRRAAEEAGDAFNAQGDNLSALTQQLQGATVSGDSLAAAMVNKLFTATMNLDQAFLGANESLTRLDEVMKKNGRTIDEHTAKGQANREAVLASVTANEQLYQAQMSAGVSAEDAAKTYDDNTAALDRQLRKAGLTAGQVDELIGKYRGIPKRVDTDIAINGLTFAINQLDETLRLINGLRDKTITVTVKQAGDLPKGQSRGGGYAIGGIRKAAAGMLIPPSDPGTTLVGEPQTGGEALIPLKGISQSRAMGLAQTVGNSYGFNVTGGGGGGMPRQLVLHATFIDPVDGGVIRKQVIRWSLDHGRDPSNAFS